MSIDFEKGLYVRIAELETGPLPRPLSSGFSGGVEYRVLAVYNPSESGECWFAMANNRNEIWYISQRHLRASSLDLGDTRFHREIPTPVRTASLLSRTPLRMARKA